MTLILPFHRPAPRPANLDARESVRIDAWREKMRSMAIQEPSPLPSAIERLAIAWEEIEGSPYFWRTVAWCSVAAVFIAALIVLR